MLTSDDLSPKLARLHELGLDAYVVKPVKRSELLRAIALVLTRGARVVEDKPAPCPVAEDGNQPKLKILLADDSPDNRLLINAYLKGTPHALEVAENGAIAVAKFISGAHFDLVLMDVQMPVMDGYTAVRKIREWEREHNRPPTPIVALTASALEQGVRESIAVGCIAHLAKPIKKSTLLEAIRRFTTELPAPATPPRRVVVEADADLHELIPNFLAHKRGDLTAITAALERRDYAALAAFGHRIKGEGGGFGFNAISQFGEKLEQAARSKDAPAVQEHLNGLADYLNRVQVVFREDAVTPGPSPANDTDGREPERRLH